MHRAAKKAGLLCKSHFGSSCILVLIYPSIVPDFCRGLMPVLPGAPVEHPMGGAAGSHVHCRGRVRKRFQRCVAGLRGVALAFVAPWSTTLRVPFRVQAVALPSATQHPSRAYILPDEWRPRYDMKFLLARAGRCQGGPPTHTSGHGPLTCPPTSPARVSRGRPP